MNFDIFGEEQFMYSISVNDPRNLYFILKSNIYIQLGSKDKFISLTQRKRIYLEK